MLLYFACTPQNKEILPPSSTQKKINTDEWSDSLILVKIFGNVHQPESKGSCCYGESTPYAKTMLDTTTFTQDHLKQYDLRGQITYHVIAKEDITLDSLDKKMVILGAEGYGCHACPGLVGIAIFGKKEDQWILEQWENDVLVIGTNGNPGDQSEIRPLGNGVYAIVVKVGSIWQGSEFRIMAMALYDKGTFKDVFSECFSSNNWANTEHYYPKALGMPAYSYTASFEFEPSKKTYPDLVMYFEGTMIDPKTNKLVLLDRPVRFKFNGEKYWPTSKMPDQTN